MFSSPTYAAKAPYASVEMGEFRCSSTSRSIRIDLNPFLKIDGKAGIVNPAIVRLAMTPPVTLRGTVATFHHRVRLRGALDLELERRLRIEVI